MPESLSGRWQVSLCIVGEHCWLRFENLATGELHTLSRWKKGWGGKRDERTQEWIVPPAAEPGVQWDQDLHREREFTDNGHVLLSTLVDDPDVFRGSDGGRGYSLWTNNCATFVRGGRPRRFGRRRYIRSEVPDLHVSWFDAHREGMFLLRNERPYLFVYRDDDLAGMLRHEMVHAVLNTSHQGLPIWLDEGLAEYYYPADPTAGKAAHLKLLRSRLRRGWQPDLARLESLETMGDLGRLEYAEAWSWVYLLEQGPPETAGLVRDYLADLRAGITSPSFSERVHAALPDADQRWLRFYRAN